MKQANFYDLGRVIQIIRQWDRTILITSQGLEIQVIGHNLKLGDSQIQDKNISLLFK